MSDKEPYQSQRSVDRSHGGEGPNYATFSCPAASRIVGLIEYALILPIAALAACTFAGVMTTAVLENCRVPFPIRAAVCFAVCVLILAWLVRFAVRDYRLRAGSVVSIGSSGLGVVRLGKTIRLAYCDIQAVRLVPKHHDAECVLYRSQGKAFSLPFDIAPFSLTQRAIEATLVDQLADRLDREIAEGRSIRVRESPLRSWICVLHGLLLLPAGMCLALTIRGIHFGIRLWRDGLVQLRRGWRGRKTDFEVTRDGLRPTASVSPSDVRSWRSLREVRVDDAGMVLRFEWGNVITASIFAENYWPVAIWIKRVWLKRASETLGGD